MQNRKNQQTCVQVLRAMLGLQVTEEQLRSIAERAIQEADIDGDGAISFDEFKKVKKKEPQGLKPAEKTNFCHVWFLRSHWRKWTWSTR